MKRAMAIAFFALATLTTGSAVAQDQGVQANVPFDFIVSGRVLPAGVYTATMPRVGVMVIRSLDERISATTTTFPPSTKGQGTAGKWVFQRYDQQYFLQGVLSPAAGIHAGVPTSSLEKSVHRQQAYPRGGAPVLVAAN